MTLTHHSLEEITPRQVPKGQKGLRSADDNAEVVQLKRQIEELQKEVEENNDPNILF